MNKKPASRKPMTEPTVSEVLGLPSIYLQCDSCGAGIRIVVRTDADRPPLEFHHLPCDSELWEAASEKAGGDARLKAIIRKLLREWVSGDTTDPEDENGANS
jgi:hypothetical protein